jgi:hypothetical protein
MVVRVDVDSGQFSHDSDVKQFQNRRQNRRENRLESSTLTTTDL